MNDRLELFRQRLLRNDDELREGQIHPGEWAHTRMHLVDGLADLLAADVAFGQARVSDDTALVLAYLAAVRALRSVHAHEACNAAACFARTEGTAWLRFERRRRERLEALLFPTAWSREWVRDAAVLAALGRFDHVASPQGPLRDRVPAPPPAVQGRIKEWGLDEEAPLLRPEHERLYGCTETPVR